MLIKKYTKKVAFALLLAASATGGFYACKTAPALTTSQAVAITKVPRILVFSKTKGFYHQSIPSGIAAIQKLGQENNFEVDTTKNAAYFVEDSLRHYDAVVFL